MLINNNEYLDIIENIKCEIKNAFTPHKSVLKIPQNAVKIARIRPQTRS